MDALNTRVSAVLTAIIDRDNLDKKNDEDSIKLIGKRSRMLESLLNLSRNTTIEHLLCMLRYDPSINIMYIIYGRPPMFNVNDNIVHSLDTNSVISDNILNNTHIRFSELINELYRQSESHLSKKEWIEDNIPSLSYTALSKITQDQQSLKDAHIIDIMKVNPFVNTEWLFKGEGPMFTDTALIVHEGEGSYKKQDTLDKFEKLLHFIKTEL